MTDSVEPRSDPQPEEGLSLMDQGGKLSGKRRLREILPLLFIGCAGISAAFYQVQNTSVGWHLAAGRWMLEHQRILDFNPFTFTAQDHAWLNHEWLFQIILALFDRGAAGVPGLLRVFLVSGLAILLYRQSHRAGMSPASAVFLSVLVLWAARWRFYLRPELFTLILLPAGMGVFLRRRNFSFPLAGGILGLIMLVGVNAHAGILILPPLLLLISLGDYLDRRKNFDPKNLVEDAGILMAMSIAALANPWGWRTLLAPLGLARLVGKAWVPNPEWLSPDWAYFQELYITLGFGFVLLLFVEKGWSRRLPFMAVAFLALRYVRNEGIFFVLLPLFFGPALARIEKGIDELRKERIYRKVRAGLLFLGSVVICLAMIDAPGFPSGLGYSEDRYPQEACRFLEKAGLVSGPIYNDVRFGGWLIGRYYPPTQVFIDDRNEIHEDLLRDLWEISRSSSPSRWQAMLDSYDVKTALLRYHEPVEIQSPEGEYLGHRGYSTLWFPVSRWALVHWDDTAMLLVDRRQVDAEWLARYEYRVLRPDDIDFLRRRLRENPKLRVEAARELSRRVSENPRCLRALDLIRILPGPDAEIPLKAGGAVPK